MSPKTRFIAGAVCPSCRSQDTIKVFQPIDKEPYFECVRCSYSESMSDLGQRAGGAGQAANHAEDAQVLSFDPKA